MLLGPVTRALGSLGFIIGFCFSEPGFFIFRTQQFCGWSVRKEPKCGMIATQATQFRSLKLYKFPAPSLRHQVVECFFYRYGVPWSMVKQEHSSHFKVISIGIYHWDLPLGFTIGIYHWFPLHHLGSELVEAAPAGA